MPVQLSEEEKCNSQAERFGTISTVQGSNTLKQSEEHKREARPERFGLAQSVTADEEAKKKARLSRVPDLQRRKHAFNSRAHCQVSSPMRRSWDH
ncbi:hypothetical protein C3L33_18357, partial [Rhododendron williamsianum]